MATSMGKFLKKLSFFLYTRFPFANAVTLLMLLGERATRENYPFLPPRVIFINVGLFIVVGVCLSSNLKRKEACLIYCGQLLYMGYSIWSVPAVRYREWVRVRMLIRIIGTVGVYTLLAFISSARNSSNELRRLGETVTGVYLLCYAYSIMNIPEETEAFKDHVLYGDLMIYVVVGALAIGALTCLSGRYIVDVCYLIVLVLLFLTLSIETDTRYWRRRGLDFWNQIRMIFDNVTVIVGFLFIGLSGKVKPQMV
ncbi:transmembrane protein 101-like [Tubulanus polymorphus]|uniref:transmembrane protein 101-like n=1 Tax=Tubulanus polymorphus TaxID=672921 RepID=UPI003DA4B1C6